MSVDEIAVTVKCSEHIVKVNDTFVVLEEDSLTKSSKFPKYLSKNMQFLHRGKPKGYGSRIHTNMRVLHMQEMQIIFGDMSCELEELEITAGTTCAASRCS